MTEAAVFTNERRADTPNGHVFVREIPGEDPPIVLMHGFPDDHRIYDKLLPRLAPRRAVAFDWLGYGRSDRSGAAGFALEDHGSELVAVLDELGITRAVLVGHDASGPMPLRSPSPTPNGWPIWCCSTPSSVTSPP